MQLARGMLVDLEFVQGREKTFEDMLSYIYSTRPEAQQTQRSGIVVASASSGSGKSTLLDMLLSDQRRAKVMMGSSTDNLQAWAVCLKSTPCVCIAATFNAPMNILAYGDWLVMRGSGCWS